MVSEETKKLRFIGELLLVILLVFLALLMLSSAARARESRLVRTSAHPGDSLIAGPNDKVGNGVHRSSPVEKQFVSRARNLGSKKGS